MAAKGNEIMKVKDIMRTDLKTCSPDTTVAQGADLMWEGDCAILPSSTTGNSWGWSPIATCTSRLRRGTSVRRGCAWGRRDHQAGHVHARRRRARGHGHDEAGPRPP